MKMGLFTADQVCADKTFQRGSLPAGIGLVFSLKYLDDEKTVQQDLFFPRYCWATTIGRLRNTYNVPLPDLRRIGDDLKKTPDADWSNLIFYKDLIAHSTTCRT